MAVSGHNFEGSVVPDAVVNEFVRELNKCRVERQTLVEQERESKAELKASGVTPQLLAIAKRASKKGLEAGKHVLTEAVTVVSSEGFKDHVTLLADLSDTRKEISARERDLRKAAVERGVSLRALTVVRSMQQMDAIEREELFDGIVNYSRALRFGSALCCGT